jgi:hypothetical protein
MVSGTAYPYGKTVMFLCTILILIDSLFEWSYSSIVISISLECNRDTCVSVRCLSFGARQRYDKKCPSVIASIQTKVTKDQRAAVQCHCISCLFIIWFKCLIWMKLLTTRSRKRRPVRRNAPKWSLWLVCCFSLIYIQCLYISTNETDERLRTQENTGSEPIIRKNVPHSSSQWPNPTLVVGLPKVRTRTIYDYFVCGNMTKVSYYHCADNIKCGLLIYDNVVQQKPPLFGTGAYDVYTAPQLDIPPIQIRRTTWHATILKWNSWGNLTDTIRCPPLF